MEPDHSKIIAAAAKHALGPLGFRRRGRSRTWLADRGFWLSIVEFQPSGFSKGSYLNVTAHWLWHPPPLYLSFDYRLPDQRRGFIEFNDAAHFETLATEQAAQAAKESLQLAEALSSIGDAARLLRAGHDAIVREPVLQGRPAGWPAFHAAVAAGLAGDTVTADSIFAIVEGNLGGDADQWIASARTAIKRNDFERFVIAAIAQARAHYQMPAWTADW